MDWLLIALPLAVGAAFAQAMGFHQAVAELARNLAVADNNKMGNFSNYQNSISPVWLVRTNGLLFALIPGSVALTGYVGGWRSALISVLLLAVGFFASRIASATLAKPSFPTYVRMTFNALANREADYLKSGDMARAEAARHFSFLISTVAGDIL